LEGGEVDDDAEIPRSRYKEFKRFFCIKFCDRKAAQKALIWNFFVSFFKVLTLEICISIAM
jgi:hypothetical protein